VRTIYKYPLIRRGTQAVMVPANCVILKVGVQDRDMFLWAMVETEAPMVPRTVHVVGTGHPVPPDLTNLDFFDTIFDGPFVWHIFIEN
jgi:hypothetical protein